MGTERALQNKKLQQNIALTLLTQRNFLLLLHAAIPAQASKKFANIRFFVASSLSRASDGLCRLRQQLNPGMSRVNNKQSHNYCSFANEALPLIVVPRTLPPLDVVSKSILPRPNAIPHMLLCRCSSFVVVRLRSSSFVRRSFVVCRRSSFAVRRSSSFVVVCRSSFVVRCSSSLLSLSLSTFQLQFHFRRYSQLISTLLYVISNCLHPLCIYGKFHIHWSMQNIHVLVHQFQICELVSVISQYIQYHERDIPK